ncbi:MAG TPA: ISNCY family transposase [Dehalococcoidia bacterium]|nr:ISNCY family transposase [Dehalococcoidia bacterium]HIM18784.1 ISNCY family transposase [Dehalococcoidia bacterium]
MEDIALSAFSVFFTQCPSFLAYQKAMEKNKGRSNAQSLFQIDRIPTPEHIRDMLDPVEPAELFPVYDSVYEALKEQGVLDDFLGVDGTRLIALDGTWYFSSKSQNIHCPRCSSLNHKNGEVTHFHSAITPVIIGPGQPYAIPLRPEFIVPQDGHEKQDCEINAAKRWLENHSAFYHTGNDTLLGDDLYAHQPFCRRTMLYGFHFIFVCKPDSHTHLYKWVAELESGKDLHRVKMRVKNNKKKWEHHTYHYANAVPLIEQEGALKVNWCEVRVTDTKGNLLHKNAFITDFKITDKNVAWIAASGRARWKIENENNNTLKTKGYHLEHNFGHGKQHLSSLLATMNILAFLFHGFLSFCDEDYRLVRMNLPTRQTFFDDVRALTRYMCFTSWRTLMDFMMRGLEIGPHAPRS